MQRTRTLLAAAVAAALLASPAAAQGRRPLTPLDLYHLRTASAATLSPDGRSVAYVVTQADSATDKYRRELWIARTDGSGARRLTWLNVSASAPAFSPDGRQLAFVSAREGKPAQVWILPLAEGGEAWPLTTLASGAGSPVWSPRGDRIAFLSSLSPAALDSASAKADSAKADAAAIRRIDANRAAATRAIRAELRDNAAKGDVQVVDRLGFLGETSVETGDEWSQLYVVDVRPDATPVRLTSNLWNTGDPAWSPDGTRIAVSVSEPLGSYHPDFERESQLVTLPAAGGAPARIHEAGYAESSPRFSPDGRWIAYARDHVATKYETAVNTELVVMHPDGSGRTSITGATDRSAGDFRWTPDGWLYFTLSSGGAVSLYRVHPGSGAAPQRVVDGPRGVLSFDVAGTAVAWVQMSPRYPSDVYSAGLDGRGERRLTTLNDSLLGRVYVADYEEVKYPSWDGKEVQGWFLRPVGGTQGPRPPLALEMHGGPHVMWGPGEASMWLEYQSLAGAGYTVFFCNPRGSSGYGEAWLQAIHQNWGTPAARDILAGVDTVLARGLGDPARQVVTGGSYAGYMTAWLVAKEAPERFKAAVAQRGVYDLTTWWGSANTFRLFESEFEGRPWEQPELARAQSPLTYVANVRTPILLLHGAQDNRVGVAGVMAFYRGLKEQHRDVELVLYPREGHEVTRSGEPAHRVDHMLRIIDWFERYVTH